MEEFSFKGGNFSVEGESNLPVLFEKDQKLNMKKKFFKLKVRSNIKTQNEKK